MNSPRRFSTVAATPEPPADVSLPAAFSAQLSELYALVQRSPHMFGSPLGPFAAGGRSLNLPRFVYFGPNASDAAVRLSFLAGFDHRDLRSTLALLRLVQGLATNPDVGQGLNLSFFPLVDVLGLAGLAPHRALAHESWVGARVGELHLLERDARLRAYHGFIRLETAPHDDVVSVRLRGTVPFENGAPALELISSADLEPLAVRWETDAAADVQAGPLTLADDLAVQPYELTMRLPGSWSPDVYADAAASILKRFVVRYRGLVTYAQDL